MWMLEYVLLIKLTNVKLLKQLLPWLYDWRLPVSNVSLAGNYQAKRTWFTSLKVHLQLASYLLSNASRYLYFDLYFISTSEEFQTVHVYDVVGKPKSAENNRITELMLNGFVKFIPSSLVLCSNMQMSFVLVYAVGWLRGDNNNNNLIEVIGSKVTAHGWLAK